MEVRSYSYTTPPSGYRLPEEIALGQVRLQVADLPRSIAFYERVIGLRVIDQSASRALLTSQDDSRVLVELNEKQGVSPVPKRGRLGLYHFAILLPNRKALGSFLRHLSDIGEYAGMSDHLVSEALYLTDPDGLGIEVYADKPRESWIASGSVLNIGNFHLDSNDLVLAAAGEKWRGAPAGTMIGHVHLYVDDLAKAETFYHDAVGFDKVNLEFPGALFMSAGGYHHNLGTNTWAAQAPPASDNDARLIEWTISVPTTADIEAIEQSVRHKGFSIERVGPDSSSVDPWGTRVRFSVAK